MMVTYVKLIVSGRAMLSSSNHVDDISEGLYEDDDKVCRKCRVKTDYKCCFEYTGFKYNL